MPHKKSHKRSRSVRRKTLKRGGYYGFAGDVAHGAGPLYTTGSESARVSGGRRSKRKQTMRRKKGGAAYGGNVSASYTGTGVRGMANYSAANTRGAPPSGAAAKGAFNVSSA